MFGRSKLVWKMRALFSASRSTMSRLVSASAVAVSEPRHPRKALRQHAEFPVLRPEIVPPLRDAVCLVDGDERDRQPFQHREEAVHHQPLGRDVEEVELAAEKVRPAPRDLLRRDRRIERGRPHPGLLQRLDLVAHQRDQRRHDDGHARAAEGRHLVADRFPLAGREQHHRIPARHHVPHHVLLLAAEGGVAEHGFEDDEGIGGDDGHGGRRVGGNGGRP